MYILDYINHSKKKSVKVIRKEAAIK